MNICIVGATGNVGRKILEVLEQKNFAFENLFLVASAKSAGKKISFKNKDYLVSNLEEFDFSKSDITFFSAGGKISEKFIPNASKHSMVIDNSSFFRMDPDVPLIVPQVNPKDLKNFKKNIVANPNCSTAQMVIALKPLHDKFKIKRIVVSTYQSVSGAGKAPMDELLDQTKKILDQNINVTATCVRVPVLVSHAESLNIEFENDYEIDEVRKLLNDADGCTVHDEQKDGGYITQLEAEGKNETFISRIRKDNTNEKALNLWIVSDNLLRGAALNAVEIAEAYIKRK